MEGSTVVADGVIEREVRIAARPETVFAFWTEPERMARWMGRDIRLDPRPGGAFRVDYNGSDIVSGTFVVVDPPSRSSRLSTDWSTSEERTVSTSSVSIPSPAHTFRAASRVQPPANTDSRAHSACSTESQRS